MKPTRKGILLWILYVSCGTFAYAVCGGTVAIQSAINAAASSGGGSVVFNVARYFTTGTVVVPTGVVLCGAIEGPFDITSEVDPAVTVVAPTLLITNTRAPFLKLNGAGAGVT